MKYRDYLILPVVCMYILFASCAFVAKQGALSGSEAEPEPSISPECISWGGSEGCLGELWYAEGGRNGECFAVEEGENGCSSICFYSGESNAASLSACTVEDMHLCCSSGEKNYDLIFIDEMTAYDCVSGTYYQRADYGSLSEQLCSGKFVNTTNERDYYVFKDNGKSAEYFGDQVFKGSWSLDTSSTVTVYDRQCRQDFHFNLVFNSYGEISGFTFNEIIYSLAA